MPNPEIPPPSLRTDHPSYADSSDGVRIAFQRAGSGAPTLVFVHGWSCDLGYWNAQVEYFRKECTVIAIDLAGHGESGMNRAAWTIESFAADVIAVLERLDVTDAILIGHSMGGPVVLEAGIRAYDRVRGVIGVEAFFDDWPLLDAEPFRQSFRETTTAFVRSMFVSDVDRGLVERVASDMASGNETVGIGALESLRQWATNDFQRALRKTRVPVRLIQRERVPDQLTIVHEHAPHLMSFDIAVMPNVGHFVMIEQPAAFNRVLEQVVDGLPRLDQTVESEHRK